MMSENMGKSLTAHFAVKGNIHRATKVVASEEDIEINDLVESILLTDKRIKKVYDRIERKNKDAIKS